MRGEALVLAVDCSTTASKAVAFDARGHEVAAASTPLTLARPGPGRHEQDGEQWWTATLTSLARCVADLDDPGRVRALCVTHQRESFVCLDSAGRTLGAICGRSGATVVPRSAQTLTYTVLYRLHQQVYPALREIFAGLARTAAGTPETRPPG